MCLCHINSQLKLYQFFYLPLWGSKKGQFRMYPKHYCTGSIHCWVKFFYPVSLVMEGKGPHMEWKPSLLTLCYTTRLKSEMLQFRNSRWNPYRMQFNSCSDMVVNKFENSIYTSFFHFKQKMLFLGHWNFLSTLENDPLKSMK